MSLSWNDDEPSHDDGDWRTRLAAWFAPSPAELAGLAVLVVGALLLSGTLWLQATSRPTSLDPTGAAAAGAGGDGDGPADAAGIGAPVDATGGADGPAPGSEGDASGSTAGAVEREAPGSVVVHVTGAVTTAGPVTIPAGARIADAVAAAGGVLADALIERVNLARVAVDGEHVHVPAPDDDPDDLPPIGGAPAPGGSAATGPSGSPSDSVGPIDLNRASASELETLPGIGPARAEAIIIHREEQGPFTSPGDLRAVPGIGEATFQRLAPLIAVG